MLFVRDTAMQILALRHRVPFSYFLCHVSDEFICNKYLTRGADRA